MDDACRVAQLVRVKEFPPVIHQGDVDDLCRKIALESPDFTEATTQRLADFLEDYSIEDDLNRIAFESVMKALTESRGQGFLINGVYGTGKSHFLAVLLLLNRFAECWDVFLRSHPEFTAIRSHFPPARRLLAVAFSLDAYSGKEHALEAIFWRETARQLDTLAERTSDRSLSRADRFDVFTEALTANGFEGAIWLIDELSTFLASRQHADLQNDASFLQFLGQRCGSGPFYVVGAIQKSVEDIGYFEPYILEQIQDRYNTRLTLQMAGVARLLRKRLIHVTDERRLQSAVAELVAQQRKVFPSFSEGEEDCVATYPFHPATLEILEAVVVRFFSRTRSALLFAHTAMTGSRFLEQSARQLVTPERVFDYFLPDIAAHPELRKFHDEVYTLYQRQAAQLCPDAPDFTLRLIKVLILLKIGNLQFSIKQLAHCLVSDFQLPGEANYGYVQYLLEKLRTEGNFVAAHRRDGDFEDSYYIDLGIRINEAVRRRIDGVLETMTPEDRRVEQLAIRCCTAEDFPLARLARPTTFSVWWENTERKIASQWTELLSLNPSGLTHWLAMLSEPATEEDGVVFVGSLFRIDEQRERWLDRLRKIESSRWKAALACLLPRSPSGEELARLREYAACHLLAEDPSLKDNRRGRAILVRLREDQPGQIYETQRLMRNLYLQGEVFVGDAVHCRTEEIIANDQSWLALLDAYAAHMLQPMFPRFTTVAPQQRILSFTGSNQLAAEILRHGIPGQLLTPSLDRIAKTIGQPLGLFKETRKGARFEAVPKPLAEDCEALVVECSSYRDLEQRMRKSPWGLPPELSQLVCAALLRQGRLVALSSANRVIPVETLRPPLREVVAFLKRGALLTEGDWQRVLIALKYWMPAIVELPLTFENQEKRWNELCRWRDDLGMKHAQAWRVLDHLLQQLSQPPALWSETRAALATLGQCVEKVQPDLPASDGLKRWMETAGAEPRACQMLSDFEKRRAFLQDAGETLVRMVHYLQDASLPERHALQEKRASLLAALRSGEAMAPTWESIRKEWERFLANYITAYVNFHREENAPSRVAAYLQLRESPEYRQFHVLNRIIFFSHDPATDPLNTLLSRFCDFPSLPTALTQRPLCPNCRRALGDPIRLPSIEETRASYRMALTDRFRRLAQPDVLASLTRYLQSAADEAVETLTPTCEALRGCDSEGFFASLSDAALKHLNLALSPRKTITRRSSEIAGLFAGQSLTRQDATRRFTSWLDGDEGLRPEDEIRFE